MAVWAKGNEVDRIVVRGVFVNMMELRPVRPTNSAPVVILLQYSVFGRTRYSLTRLSHKVFPTITFRVNSCCRIVGAEFWNSDRSNELGRNPDKESAFLFSRHH